MKVYSVRIKATSSESFASDRLNKYFFYPNAIAIIAALQHCFFDENFLGVRVKLGFLLAGFSMKSGGGLL